jgi:ABC-type multidrug transport system ATPase subunit
MAAKEELDISSAVAMVPIDTESLGSRRDPGSPMESPSGRTFAAMHGLLAWEDLRLTIESPTAGKIDILRGVSGFATPGRLLAIMGASGSGKTSFLDVVCGRTLPGARNELTGKIFFNGRERKKSVHFSYVPQHDTLLNAATVRETLETAAQLRIADLSTEALKDRVDGVLTDLGLAHCEHALVGGGDIRGLSGGERRRVSIGQEIVSSQHPVLCLDEPTTGLDSTTAENVMATLKDLARKKNIYVIATIHQPNSNITALFDDLMVMSGGRCVYFGSFEDAVPRFADSGFICPLYCNPTDFFIGVVSVSANADLLSKAHDEWITTHMDLRKTEFIRQTSEQSVSSELAEHEPKGFFSRCVATLRSYVGVYPTSRFTQIRILSLRVLRQWLRDPGMLESEAIQYIFIALFIGGMYFNVDDSLDGGVYNRTASLFFLLSVMIFTPPFTTIMTFSHERALLRKERQDKMYGVTSWLLAKTAITVPIEAALCLVFSAISYFMIGYQRTPEKFFVFFIIMLLFQLSAESVGLLFAVSNSSPVFAIVWLSLVLIVALSLTGFLTYSMPVYYDWIMQSNLMRFALLGLLANEFDGLVVYDPASGESIHGDASLPDSLLPEYSAGVYIAILVAFLVALRLLCWAFLRLGDKSIGEVVASCGPSSSR